LVPLLDGQTLHYHEENVKGFRQLPDFRQSCVIWALLISRNRPDSRSGRFLAGCGGR